MVDSLVQQHIRAVIAFEEDYEKRKEALLADHETKGDRIISGGQTYGQEWEITDYRTGEVIAAGDGGIEGYAEIVHEHGRTWVHVDPITEHLMDTPDPITPGLPKTLCEQLTEWVRDRATEKDINEVLTWGNASAQEPETITRAR